MPVMLLKRSHSATFKPRRPNYATLCSLKKAQLRRMLRQQNGYKPTHDGQNNTKDTIDAHNTHGTWQLSMTYRYIARNVPFSQKKNTHTHGALHTTHKAHTAHTTHKDMTHSTQHIKNIRQDKSNHAVERVPTNFSHFAQITIEMT